VDVIYIYINNELCWFVLFYFSLFLVGFEGTMEWWMAL